MSVDCCPHLKAIFASVTTPGNSYILDSKHIHYATVHKEHFTEVSLNSALKNFGSLRTYRRMMDQLRR